MRSVVDAGDVPEHIEPPELVDARPNGGRTCPARRDRPAVAPPRRPPCRTPGAGSRRACRRRCRRRGRRRSRPQPQRDRPPDPRPGPGDERHLACEPFPHGRACYHFRDRRGLICVVESLPMPRPCRRHRCGSPEPALELPGARGSRRRTLGPRLPHPGHAGVASPGHPGCLRLDPPPAPVLPPQHGVQQPVTRRRACTSQTSRTRDAASVTSSSSGPKPMYCQHTWARSRIRSPGAALSQSMKATGLSPSPRSRYTVFLGARSLWHTTSRRCARATFLLPGRGARGSARPPGPTPARIPQPPAPPGPTHEPLDEGQDLPALLVEPQGPRCTGPPAPADAPAVHGRSRGRPRDGARCHRPGPPR